MIAINVPPQVRFVSNRIKNATGITSFKALCSLVGMFLLNKSSLCETVRDCAFASSVSTLSRSVQLFQPNRLMRRIRSTFLRKMKSSKNTKDRFAYVIDDTDNPKYGKSMKGVGTWGGSKGKFYGQKVVALIIVDTKTGKSYPVAYCFAKKDDNSTSLEKAIELLQEALLDGLPCLPVITDTWFSAVEFMKQVEDLGCEYVGEIKSNRKVKINPAPNSPWRKLDEAFKGFLRTRVSSHKDGWKLSANHRKKVISERVIQIKKRKTPIKCVAVFNRRNSKSAFSYYISTNKISSGARIWWFSRVRWAIECVFRTCKQNLSFGNLSCCGEAASHLAVEMSLYLYGLIELERRAFGFREDDSIDRCLSKMRARTLRDSIRVIIGNPQKDRVELLRNRQYEGNASRKPVNKPAA